MCGNVDTALGVVSVGRRIELRFPASVNEIGGTENVGLFADVVCVTPGVAGVFAGVVGIVFGIVVGIAGIVVGIAGILVGIVGIEFMTGDEFIGADMPPIDWRHRPSRVSTEIDALLFARHPVTQRWLCSCCGFIVFSLRLRV
jgi:hypothetical protein